MRAATLRATALELRSLVETLGSDESRHTGPIVVSGMLAEQLARELSAGAAPGAVVVGTGAAAGPAEVAVHVIAGEPSDDDRAFVRAAERADVPMVLVQLWPQAKWTEPFVLTPFVVECRAGAGFPIGEIASRIAEAAEHPAALAGRIPALRGPVARILERQTAIRCGLLAALGAGTPGTRRALTLEQARLVAQLQALASPTSREPGGTPVLAATAAAVLGSGFAFRAAARSLGRVAPTPLANAVVAALGSWAVGRVLRAVESRL